MKKTEGQKSRDTVPLRVNIFVQLKGDSWVSARTETTEMSNGHANGHCNGLSAAASGGQTTEYRGRSGTFTRSKPSQPISQAVA
jgi:hypothetical protein